MKNLREKIERGFEKLGRGVIRFRWLVLVIVVLLTGVMISQLRFIKFDMATEAFLADDDPKIQDYNEFRAQFGNSENILIMLQPSDVFNLDFLTKLKAFHEALEERLPYVKEVNSLINARQTKGDEGQLLVEELLENFPETEEELIALKRYVISSPLYSNLLVSEDGTLTTVVIKLEAFSSVEEENDSDMIGDDESSLPAEVKQSDLQVLTNEENAEVVKTTRIIIAEFETKDFPIRLTGSPVVTDYLKKSMQGDMKRFIGLAILAIFLFLLVLFRRISGVLLPLLTVILSVVYTFGLLSLTGTAIKVPTVVLPSFLLAIGVGAAVHLMTIFFKYYTEGNKKEAIVEALGHSGLPIAMTGLTTAAGLMSFSTARVEPIAELGFFAACGVLISLCLTLLLLPALLAIVPAKPILSQGAERGTSRIDRILLGCGNLAVSRPWLVTATSFAVILVAAAGIFRLDFSHHVLHWFKANSEIRRNTELIDGKMKGSISMEIIVDTGVENGLYHPETMNSLDELEKKLMEYRGGGKDMFVGKTLSLADMLKEINQALNENRSEHYSIPQSRQAIAQELLLFENSGSDDLEDVVDSRFSKARLTAKVPWNDSVAYVDMLDYVRRQIKETFHDKHKITVTGLMVIMMETIFAMMQSTITSYAVAGVIITVLMILLIGRIRMGLISMIPNLSPIVITLGLMGWLGIKLDMFTLLIGSIAIGLAVDDTIHFFHNFRKYYEETGSTRKAVQETLTTAGRAMLVTTLVLTTGFWLFMFASMDNIFFFGLLTGLTIMFAFLADVLLAPALLTIITKSK